MSLKNIVLYSHTGSGNHGCEALARSTAMLLQDLATTPIQLISWRPEEDRKYMSDVDLKFVARTRPQSLVEHIGAKVWKTLTGSIYFYDRSDRYAIMNVRDSLCFSIGGDNYCYKDFAVYGRENKYLNKQGNRTILWGCSIEPDLLRNVNVKNDLKLYSLITARESITFHVMQELGLKNVQYCPDTAFLLPQQDVILDSRFGDGVVGINISPMVLEYENGKGITLENYINLIKYVLEKTEWNIALIPHVIVDFGDDLEVLKIIKQYFSDITRVFIVDEKKELNSCQLKYVIAHCQALVTARTHASIAGYSTGVPTLVTGYSVKARGIAKDIFGTWEGLVCPVQNLQSEYDLVYSFTDLLSNKDLLKNNMKDFIQKIDAYYTITKESVRLLI